MDVRDDVLVLVSVDAKDKITSVWKLAIFVFIGYSYNYFFAERKDQNHCCLPILSIWVTMSVSLSICQADARKNKKCTKVLMNWDSVCYHCILTNVGNLLIG